VFTLLLLAFILLPLVELAILMEIGRRLGTLPTIALVVLTGALGAFLAKQQGLGVLRRIRADMEAGRMPGPAIVDGVLILLAGAVLITPGVLTDVAGFLCLVPATRAAIRAALWRAIERRVRDGRAAIRITRVDDGPAGPPDVR
jgi:UPF0716 protein FxsA